MAEADKKRTLELYAEPGKMLKPAELIDIRGAGKLTLSARRLYNDLVQEAFGPEMGEDGHEWTIKLRDLRGGHNGNERIEESIESLMKTLVVVRLPDGGEMRTALLGRNTLWTETNGARRLTFSLGEGMPELLKDSRIFGKLDQQVMHHLTSKYALSLYEMVAKRVRLKHKWSEDIELEDMRDLLGVPEGKLSAYHQFRQKALDPAVAEVNQLADFGCAYQPLKDGRKVVGIRLSWYQKDLEGQKQAYRELTGSKVGRKARREGNVEAVPKSADADGVVLE